MRFPTAVDDVSQCLKLLIDAKRAERSRACGVFHCSSPERSTKYTQAKLMAACLGVPAEHLAPNAEN